MNSLRAYILSALIFLGYSTACSAQSSFFKDTQLGVNAHLGWNLPEYQFISFYTNDYIRSIDVNLTKEATGKNEWERLFNYPSCGISLFYSSLGNDDLFGRELALTYFFKVDLINREKFNFYNRTGIGLSYVSQKFDLVDNYRNVAVGSNGNIHFTMRWGADYEITDQLELDAGISFDHFSNGNTAEPNLGLNYLTGYAGVNYRLGDRSERITAELSPLVRENSFALFTSIGGKATRSLSSGYFLTSSLALEAERSVWRALYLGVGADLFYDSSQETQLTAIGKSYKPIQSFQTGIHLTQTLRYRKFSLSIQEGFYIGLKENTEGKPMYNRGIIRYRISDKLWIRIAMKSHLVVLDYPELGVGIKL